MFSSMKRRRGSQNNSWTFWRMLQNPLSVVNIAHIHGYLKIIPRARVGYEMIDSQRGARRVISYPTSASGIIVLLKTPPRY